MTETVGVDQVLIDWSSTRRRRIENVLEGLTHTYAQYQGWLPGEKARHGMGWQAAQDTRWPLWMLLFARRLRHLGGGARVFVGACRHRQVDGEGIVGVVHDSHSSGHLYSCPTRHPLG
ncbi:hypothetical protein R2B67_00280 [Streptomyces cyaneofuscatus]|uniref:hypothetical protein n=1 Tax=Streptomyces cyaneofuscatus TaxID=66883 RepID=UPI00295367D7|nr:hypothetical protein [Streptomyces cyaneofuscatus]WOP07066.1 hypothetical protein R2B67_00280 [Streptomyces cyaneofuscatus]